MRSGASAGHRVQDKAETPSAVHSAAGGVGRLIEVQAPGSVGNGIQINAAAGSGAGPSVERERTLRSRMLDGTWKRKERTGGVRRRAITGGTIGCAGRNGGRYWPE